MKHLFYIHSPLNYVVAKQIISFRKLLLEDCVFLYDRIEPLKSETTITQYAFPHDPLPAAKSFGVKKAFWEQWQHIRKFDERISQIAGNESFIFYALFSWGNFFYLTISHPLCRGYYFMEDGTVSLNPLSYFKPLKQKSWLRQVLYNLNFPKRGVISSKLFYDLKHPKFKGVLATCESMFPDFSQKNIIEFAVNKTSHFGDYEHVLVMDGVADFELITHETYAAAIALLPDWFIQKNIRKVYVKYQKPHLGKEDSKRYTKAIFDKYKNDIEFIEIPSEVILEEIAFNSTANFYINISSIGFYAYLAGRSVYTWIKFIQVYDTTFEMNKNQPADYLNSLIYMNPPQ